MAICSVLTVLINNHDGEPKSESYICRKTWEDNQDIISSIDKIKEKEFIRNSNNGVKINLDCPYLIKDYLRDECGWSERRIRVTFESIYDYDRILHFAN